MQKNAAILAAAKSLFGEHGYAGTSMDAVARQAEVSKLTVYSHFGDKNRLFRAAVRAHCAELFPEHGYLTDDSLSVEEGLLTIARSHARLATSHDAVGMWRAITSSSRHAPQLGQLLWEEGALRMRVLVSGYLEHMVEQGRLEIDDCDLAATQFMALLRGDLHLKRLLHCADADCKEFQKELATNAEAAVSMFLRAYQSANA